MRWSTKAGLSTLAVQPFGLKELLLGVWLRVDHWPSALGRHPRLRCGALFHVANRTLSYHGIGSDAVQFRLPLFESWTYSSLPQLPILRARPISSSVPSPACGFWFQHALDRQQEHLQHCTEKFNSRRLCAKSIKYSKWKCTQSSIGRSVARLRRNRGQIGGHRSIIGKPFA